MHLLAHYGHYLDMHVVRYEFPELDEDDWLMIAVRARYSAGEWQRVAPCMQTYEADRLATWLDAVAAGTNTREKLDFLEPNLCFELVDGQFGRALRVYFELECRPPWAYSQRRVLRDLWVDLPLADLNLAEAARWLREELRDFPERGEREGNYVFIP